MSELLEDGKILFGPPPKNDQHFVYGVFNAQGKQIIPTRFSRIDYDRKFKRFHVTTDVNQSQPKQGILDENGRESFRPFMIGCRAYPIWATSPPTLLWLMVNTVTSICCQEKS
jgi:hypothetical protein